jgi:uncharacterized membrane protein
MRVTVSTEVAAPAGAVWEVVTDPARYLHIMDGFTRWELAGGPERGLGARYRMLMRVGSAEIGGLVEVVEYHEARELAWHSVTGIDQRGRWRLREPRPGRTRVELRLTYGVAGAGFFGWLAEHAAGPIVRGHLNRSLAQLKRQVEHDELRRAAARRRGERRSA